MLTDLQKLYLFFVPFFMRYHKNDENNQATISEAIGSNQNIILKIDIEGDEFKILEEIDKNLDKINLLIIEFHDMQKNLKKVENFIENTKLPLSIFE